MYNVIAKFIGLTKFYVWEVWADIFVAPHQTQTLLGTILGFLVDFVTGSFLGIIFGLFVEWRGTKYYLLKGCGVGLFAWIFLFGIVFHALPHTPMAGSIDVLSNISAFIGHSVFGLSMAFAYMKLAKLNRSHI
jgi:Na+/proline symporter